MPAKLSELLGDLTAETADLTSLLSGLDAGAWRTPTPAPGWTVADQVSHLAFFDDAAVLSATDPERFTAGLGTPFMEGELSTEGVAEAHRGQPGAELLAWFERSRGHLLEVFARLDPATRIPWFGPPMSAASSVTARIMETWAHGQDIADGLGLVRVPTSRLRQVAHLAVRALPYSYLVRGLPVPEEPVRVELTLPDGTPLTWGPAGAANRVTGQVLDFCLLTTRRRHRSDTAVRAEGPVADEWLDIAQAFAGPPGEGRRPGQHA
ncbi:MAG TPA: TIGR03084 family metal-binding protein [Streptosporangiaceae bacterium]|nr:TIGR03084 family metal-binding protein [Streptosporangiaceae bacterium]